MVKICDLKASAGMKLILANCIKPKNIAGICASTDLGYSTVCQNVKILEAKGLVKKVYGYNKTLFTITDEVEI